MKRYWSVILVIAVCSGLGRSTAQYELKCRSCNKAASLSECTHLTICDNRYEECYLDKVATNMLTLVYNGGCRPKRVCDMLAMVGRKRDMIPCSKCCHTHDCNKALCGITVGTTSTTSPVTVNLAPTPVQCYTCDHRYYSQSEVKNPKDCITIGTCAPNEICYANQLDEAGSDVNFYGCMSALKCQFLMKSQFEIYKICVANVTAPGPGLTWNRVCGNVHRRATSLCHSCCSNTACNYGSCQDINDRLFKLALAGMFDINTLKITP